TRSCGLSSLGINLSLPYRFGSATLASGDQLLNFTDGLVEAEDDKANEYGEERQLQLLPSLQTATASEAVKSVISSVDAFVGLTRQHDDITCLVLRMA